ncbi:MAG: SufE family protein [Candidatus Cryptobacteroides sp.]|nr:SufE family protein [Candidatus Cryptobacteroides sp.]
MTLQEAKQSVIDEFSMFDEWLDKYEYLIELGKGLAPFPEEKKTEDRLIKGCQSRVWLDYSLQDGQLFFTADSDAIITKGIISLLINVYSGRTPQEIVSDDFSFVEQIGLRQNLSPTRAGGLASMIETIRKIAQDNDKVLTPEDVKELAPLYDSVILALKQVYDPEIPVNIYDLGLIYELNIDKSRHVFIKMTFTAPNCPMADEVLEDVKHNVELTPGISGCSIELTFEPVWDQSMLSDEARIALGMDPEM